MSTRQRLGLKLTVVLVSILTLGFFHGAEAVVKARVSAVPAVQNLQVNGTTSVDVIVDNIDTQLFPDIGAFEFDVRFDPVVVNITNVVINSTFDLVACKK